MGMGLLQPWHLLLILLIVLIVFGAGKLGQVGGALGKSVKEFKTTVNDGMEDDLIEEPEIAESRPVRATKVVSPVERRAEPLRREEI